MKDLLLNVGSGGGAPAPGAPGPGGDAPVEEKKEEKAEGTFFPEILCFAQGIESHETDTDYYSFLQSRRSLMRIWASVSSIKRLHLGFPSFFFVPISRKGCTSGGGALRAGCI